MRNLLKSKVRIITAILTISVILFSLGNYVYGKYVLTKKLSINFSTSDYYFEVSSDITTITEFPTTINVTVKNHNGTNYTDKDLKYTVGISKADYTIAITDGTTRTLTGGSKQEETFAVTINSSTAITDGTFQITINVIEPYSDTKTIDITTESPIKTDSTIRDGNLIPYTWTELGEIAKVISDNSSTITSNTNSLSVAYSGGTASLGVGDYILINGKKVRIIGFNHDKLTNTSTYGGTNTYAGITFEYVDFITDNLPMNENGSNQGGWGATPLREELNGELYNTLNSVIGNGIIKQVKKAYAADYSSTTLSYSNDYLWLLSNAEITGANVPNVSVSSTEGSRYKYYKNIKIDNFYAVNLLLKKPSNEESRTWWLRSGEYSLETVFRTITKNGSGGVTYAYSTIGVAPGFSI